MQPPSGLDGTSFYVPTPANVAATTAPPKTHTHMWKDGESMGFHDVLDTINPLQHIPVVSTLYRWITGDTPGNMAEMVGDGIYGGPVGLGFGMLAIALKEETGKGPGEMALAAVGLDSGTSATAVATAPQSAPAAAAATTAAATPAASASASSNLPAPPVAGIPLASAMATAPAPLIPLQKPAANPTAASAASATSATAASSASEQAFLAQKAAMQRSLYGPRPPVADHPITQPVPLHLTGPALPAAAPRPILIPASGVQPAVPSTPQSAPTAGLPSAALPNQSVDVSQRMMDALDKYAKLQQERQRGQQLDMTP